MIRPGVPAPALAARLGTSVLRERAGVRYHELRSRSLLNRCDSARVPFEWTVNPFRGCAMGCRYCYAAYTHDFLGRDGKADFHSVVYVKTGGEEETLRRLRAAVGKGELVALGTATDPYQPGERAARTTRRFLELAAGLHGLRLMVTTKGALVLRDLDLLRLLHERSSLSVAVSLVSPRAELLRRIEPWAPPPDVRIEVLRRLVAAGLDVRLSLAPVLPGLTDGEADLDRLLSRVAAAGVRRMSWQLLFLRSPTREAWLAFLAREFPDRLRGYRRAYAGRAYLGGPYVERLRSRIDRLRERHGLASTPFERSKGVRAGRQLDLWS
jgi:DNA repair photolyase